MQPIPKHSEITDVKIFYNDQKTITGSGNINGKHVTFEVKVKSGKAFPVDQNKLKILIESSFVEKTKSLKNGTKITELRNKDHKELKKIELFYEDAETEKVFKNVKDSRYSLNQQTKKVDSTIKRVWNSVIKKAGRVADQVRGKKSEKASAENKPVVSSRERAPSQVKETLEAEKPAAVRKATVAEETVAPPPKTVDKETVMEALKFPDKQSISPEEVINLCKDILQADLRSIKEKAAVLTKAYDKYQQKPSAENQNALQNANLKMIDIKQKVNKDRAFFSEINRSRSPLAEALKKGELMAPFSKLSSDMEKLYASSREVKTELYL